MSLQPHMGINTHKQTIIITKHHHKSRIDRKSTINTCQFLENRTSSNETIQNKLGQSHLSDPVNHSGKHRKTKGASLSSAKNRSPTSDLGHGRNWRPEPNTATILPTSNH